MPGSGGHWTSTPAWNSSVCRTPARTPRAFLRFCPFSLHSDQLFFCFCFCFFILFSFPDSSSALTVRFFFFFFRSELGFIEYWGKVHLYLRTQVHRAVYPESRGAQTIFVGHKLASHCLKFTFPYKY